MLSLGQTRVFIAPQKNMNEDVDVTDLLIVNGGIFSLRQTDVGETCVSRAREKEMARLD